MAKNKTRKIDFVNDYIACTARAIQNVYVTFCHETLGLTDAQAERIVKKTDMIDKILSDIGDILEECDESKTKLRNMR